MVVPICAPRITPMAWRRVISPALTNPTTMTVVALLLCMMVVTNIPTRIPIRGFLVKIFKI